MTYSDALYRLTVRNTSDTGYGSQRQRPGGTRLRQPTAAVTAIPTFSQWAYFLLAVLPMATSAVLLVKRRTKSSRWNSRF